MKKKLKFIGIVVLFLAGLSLLLYPFVANKWNTYRQSKLISNYEEAVSEKEIDYEAEYQRALTYNENLSPSILPDSFAIADAREEADEEYMACLNIAGDEMMGIVEIPKIDVNLPIYHTTEEEVLDKAAGHLEGSSLPIGGVGTHAVISAHRGLPSATLFTDLDQLAVGDHFMLHVLDRTLCYEVDQINTVEPEETELLSMEEGMDLVTLLTCTPYGVNSHRLLVRGHRVEMEPEALAEADGAGKHSLHTRYGLLVILGLIVTAIITFILYRRNKQIAFLPAEASKSDIIKARSRARMRKRRRKQNRRRR